MNRTLEKDKRGRVWEGKYEATMQMAMFNADSHTKLRSKRQNCQSDVRPLRPAGQAATQLARPVCLFDQPMASGYMPLPAVFALKAFVNGCVNILPCFNNTENE